MFLQLAAPLKPLLDVHALAPYRLRLLFVPDYELDLLEVKVEVYDEVRRHVRVVLEYRL